MVDTEENKSSGLNKSEIYKIVLDTRNMEIELFWKRSNYFLVLNTAVAAGFFLKATNEHQLILGFFGFIISILWFLVSSGSKFWQSRWERRLHIVEQSLNPEIKLFSSDWEEINQDVNESIEFSKHSYIRKCLDKIVLKKPSVKLHDAVTLNCFHSIMGHPNYCRIIIKQYYQRVWGKHYVR